MIKLLDTFDDISKFYEKYHYKCLEDRLEGWLIYINNYPEIKIKCQEDHEKLGYSWKDIAFGKSLPFIDALFDKMVEAHNNIVNIVPLLAEKVDASFAISEDIYIIIYYGLGNGAGWATTYKDKPAILLGIEKIAELGWESHESIVGLIYHELCHIVHGIMRGNEGIGIEYENDEDTAIWRLYIEGFAQFYEHLLIGRELYHQDSNGWLIWCKKNHKYLCQKYLNCITNNITAKDFYGDWHNVDGYSDVGYYLGCEFIRYLQCRYGINEITRLNLEELRELSIEFLNKG